MVYIQKSISQYGIPGTVQNFSLFQGENISEIYICRYKKKLNTSIAQKDDIQSVYTDTEAAFTN